MENPQGRILSTHLDDTPPHVVVEVAASISCARCASGKGCGAGLLGGDDRPRRVDALIARDLELDEGDQVRIELAPNNLLRASSIVYGLPLLGALAGAAGAWLSGMGDPGAALAALAGASLGMLAGRSRLQKNQCLRAFTPVVTTRISTASN
jgi:sigma-E factor negative regulatory protein RseC